MASFIRNGKKVRLTFIINKEEEKTYKSLRRSLPLEEITLRTPRNWATLSQRNLSSSSSQLQVTFPQVANLKSHVGLSHTMKVCRCQYLSSHKSSCFDSMNFSNVIHQCTPPQYASGTHHPFFFPFIYYSGARPRDRQRRKGHITTQRRISYRRIQYVCSPSPSHNSNKKRSQ